MIGKIRSDHGTEFDQKHFAAFCDNNGYTHDFSALKTPQQNGVVERKNRVLQEMARTMLLEYELPKFLWAEAINTACYVSNRVFIRPMLNKTAYELWHGKIPNINYFKVFGCKCFILKDREQRAKFDSRIDEGRSVGYSTHSKAYRVYNDRKRIILESIHVVFYETDPLIAKESLSLNPTGPEMIFQDSMTQEKEENQNQ